jgi:hypothetical protein
MSQVQQIALIAGIGFLAFGILGRFVLRFGARRKIHRTFEESGAIVTRIRRFNGFLDLGSVSAAATGIAYVVTAVAHDGRVSDQLCLVRYIPLIGLVRSIEVWPYEPASASRVTERTSNNESHSK